jgi:hypothetical protein
MCFHCEFQVIKLFYLPYVPDLNLGTRDRPTSRRWDKLMSYVTELDMKGTFKAIFQFAIAPRDVLEGKS